MTKQLKLEKKRKIKEEKEIAKQLKLEKKKKIKKEKKLQNDYSENLNKKIATKKISKTIEGSSFIGNLKVNKFKDLVDNIIKKNTFRPYPDINDIPD